MQKKYPDKNVVIVTHNTLTRSIMCATLGEVLGEGKYYVFNCEAVQFVIENGKIEKLIFRNEDLLQERAKNK